MVTDIETSPKISMRFLVDSLIKMASTKVDTYYGQDLEIKKSSFYVTTDLEVLRIVNECPREYERSCELNIYVIVDFTKLTCDGRSYLDNFAIQLEELMEEDRTLDGVVQDLNLKKVETKVSEEGDSPIGSLCLTYDAKYMRYNNGN